MFDRNLTVTTSSPGASCTPNSYVCWRTRANALKSTKRGKQCGLRSLWRTYSEWVKYTGIRDLTAVGMVMRKRLLDIRPELLKSICSHPAKNVIANTLGCL